MGRYDLPDPLCRHKATVRVSSHEDLLAAAQSGAELASTYCCDRLKCQEDAKEWVEVSARVDEAVVTPLTGGPR